MGMILGYYIFASSNKNQRTALSKRKTIFQTQVGGSWWFHLNFRKCSYWDNNDNYWDIHRNDGINIGIIWITGFWMGFKDGYGVVNGNLWSIHLHDRVAGSMFPGLQGWNKNHGSNHCLRRYG